MKEMHVDIPEIKLHEAKLENKPTWKISSRSFSESSMWIIQRHHNAFFYISLVIETLTLLCHKNQCPVLHVIISMMFLQFL